MKKIRTLIVIVLAALLGVLALKVIGVSFFADLGRWLDILVICFVLTLGAVDLIALKKSRREQE